MNKNLRAIFCIFFAQFLSVGNACADELVRHNTDVNHGVESIIRHYTSNTDIVCDRYPGRPSFTMYIEGVSSAYSIDVEMYDILDFEIYRGMVYFCGTYISGNTSMARAGFFSLSGFSSATFVQVYYFDYPSMKEFRALELDYFAMRLHLMTIGKGHNDEPILVDFIENGTYWDVQLTDIYNDTLSLADIAVTDSFVVIASTKEKSQDREGMLWFFLKPTTTGASILQSSSINYEYIGTNFSPNVLVRKIIYNFFVVAHTPYTPLESPDFYITKFQGKSVVDRFLLSVSSNFKHICLKDIATESEKAVVHLLINFENSGIPSSAVYELITSTYGNMIPLFGHSYSGVYATSLNKRSDMVHFVASGFKESNGYPYILKYLRGTFGYGCLPAVQNAMERIQFSTNPQKIIFPRSVGTIVPVSYAKEVKEYSVMVDCSVHVRDPEQE